MTLGELTALYHNLADDRESPGFAVDDDVIGWLNEAEREAAFRARLIIDTTIELGIQASKAIYLVGFEAIWFRRVQLTLQTVPLTPCNYKDLDKYHHGWLTATGTSKHYVTGLDSIGQELRLRTYPIPVLDDDARLIIVRHPLEPMVEPENEPEIESRWHEELVHWALYRGYSRPDADSLDVDKSLKYYERFEKTFGTREAAIEAEAADERSRANRMEYANGIF